MKSICIIIPTIRDLTFLDSWGDQFSDCSAIIVEDHPTKQIQTPHQNFANTLHVSWEDIERDFGKDGWIFSRKNAGIRSYGFWKAHTEGADIIITLDDDCFPVSDGFVRAHVDNLHSRAPEGWTATFPHPDFMYTRGFPYSNRNKRRTVVSHGLWSNKMDLDAKTQIATGDVNMPPYSDLRQYIPAGHMYPMSSMNLAFVRDVVPLMFFPLMGTDPEGASWGYDRFDDIWAGLFSKKIIDHLGWSVLNGTPFVEHRKASDPHVNLIKERTGLKVNETLWLAVNEVRLTKNTSAACYRELAQKILFPKSDYFVKLRRAMLMWADLFM